MSKKNTLRITGGPNASLVFTANHKKGGGSVLRVYPIRYQVNTRTPVDYRIYRKEEAILILKFEDQNALETLMGYLAAMRDNHIYFKAQMDATVGLLDKRAEKLVKEWEEIEKSMSPKFKDGSILSEMQEDEFKAFGKAIEREYARRYPQGSAEPVTK